MLIHYYRLKPTIDIRVRSLCCVLPRVWTHVSTSTVSHGLLPLPERSPAPRPLTPHRSPPAPKAWRPLTSYLSPRRCLVCNVTWLRSPAEPVQTGFFTQQDAPTFPPRLFIFLPPHPNTPPSGRAALYFASHRFKGVALASSIPLNSEDRRRVFPSVSRVNVG